MINYVLDLVVSNKLVVVIFLQVKGDNYKRCEEGKEGAYTFELGCDIFTRKGDAFKIEDKWWLIDTYDVCGRIREPVVVKVTVNRIKYMFSDDVPTF